MSQIKDIKGCKFGSLIAIKRVGSNEKGHALWECKCDCGKTIINLSNRLLSGNSKTCGCRNGHGMRYTRIYRTWINMCVRCRDPKARGYKYYGGKGIEVCVEWKDFKKFLAWALKNGYSDSLTIDRKDSKKGYYPDNCQWLTLSENSKRTRRSNGN